MNRLELSGIAKKLTESREETAWKFLSMIGPGSRIEICFMSAIANRERRLSEKWLGFRVDEATKALIERAAWLERRKLRDFCKAALTEAAQQTIARHETLVLSERDRAVFFDTLVHPPRRNARLKRAFADLKRHVAR